MHKYIIKTQYLKNSKLLITRIKNLYRLNIKKNRSNKKMMNNMNNLNLFSLSNKLKR